MERKLGEIDRARAIYVHCSQICDPKVKQSNSKFNSKLKLINTFKIVKSKILANLERV